MQQGPITIANDPVLFAYSPLKGRNGKTRWKCLGAAWPHATGAGLTVQLDLVPIHWDGRIILLEPDEHDDAEMLKRGRPKRP
ncbi:MAG: hypothetical protein AB7E81_17820 [Hyphomicrobiaceae bacterium]